MLKQKLMIGDGIQNTKTFFTDNFLIRSSENIIAASFVSRQRTRYGTISCAKRNGHGSQAAVRVKSRTTILEGV